MKMEHVELESPRNRLVTVRHAISVKVKKVNTVIYKSDSCFERFSVASELV